GNNFANQLVKDYFDKDNEDDLMETNYLNELAKDHFNRSELVENNNNNKSVSNEDWLETEEDTMDNLYVGRLKKSEGLEDAKKRTFLCKHTGTYKPNKSAGFDKQRNKTLCKVGCTWHINIVKKDEHRGYNLDQQSIQFLPQFRKLSEEMLEDICFWTLECNLNATKQYRMLVSKYQCRVIKQDLYNVIHIIRHKKVPVKNDAFKVLNFLLEKKADNLE
ncbi:5890_t:CDS:2, partial [Racocetra fulgida]